MTLAIGRGTMRTVTTTVTAGSSSVSAVSGKSTSSRTSKDLTAGQIVAALRCNALPIGQVENYTQRTDVNHLLGRPGGYVSKANWVDARIKDQVPGFDVADGGSVEVFTNLGDAKSRLNYLVSIGKAAPALMNEYDYLVGRAVLRVSTTLIPSEAAEYKKETEGVIANPNSSHEQCTPPHRSVSTKPPKPLAAKASGFIGGGNPPLPAGAPGKLAIVATGPYGDSTGTNGKTVPVVVRNNTSQIMTNITVTGTANTKGGELLATGRDQDLYPNVVRPGEITLGYVYFDDKQLPNAVFKLEATGTPQASDEYDTRADLLVTQATHRGGSVVGYLKNGLPSGVTGPIQVYVLCFSTQGRLLAQYEAFTDQDSAAPGKSIPFVVDLLTPSGGSASCPIFLAAAGAHTD